MRFKIVNRYYKANVKKFTQVMKKNMDKLWRIAIREFLIAASTHVHVDTGMSRASFLPLAAKVRASSLIMIDPKRGPRKGLDTFTAYHPTRYKSIAEGRKAGEKSFNIRFGTPTAPYWEFRFDIAVFHWSLHEPAWQALDAGGIAFMAALQREKENIIPRLAEWMEAKYVN